MPPKSSRTRWMVQKDNIRSGFATRFSKSNKSGKNHRIFSQRHREHRENFGLLQQILRVLRGSV